MTDLIAPVSVKNDTLISLASDLKLASQLLQKLAESGGEITPEISAGMAELIPDSKEKALTKIDSYAFMQAHALGIKDQIKSQMDDLNRYLRSVDKMLDQMDARLEIAMGILGVIELSGRQYRYKQVACAMRLSITDVTQIPASYTTETVSYEPNKAKIKADLADGLNIPGCKLEGGKYIKRFLNNDIGKKTT